jgi:hypothetical protein
MEPLHQPLLTVDPPSVRSRSSSFFARNSSRREWPIIAAADQHVSNAAHDAAAMLEEADEDSLARGNVTGNVSATRASSAACSREPSVYR